MDEEVVLARTALLDGLEALQVHLDALILVGAQAVYLHTGAAQVALAEYTTDADLAIDPELIGVDPRIEDAMAAAGFTPDPRPDVLGTWLSPQGIPIDLLVPDAVAGRGSRSADVPPHHRRSMRRTRGLEGALVDSRKMSIRSFRQEDDGREYVISVAGPAALLVAKLHKIGDRIDQPARTNNKDAHDVYRLLVATETSSLTTRLLHLRSNPVSEQVANTAVALLHDLFAAGPHAAGARMAGAAEDVVGNPAAVAESVSLLAQDLLAELDQSK